MYAIYQSSNLIDGKSKANSNEAMQELQHIIKVTTAAINDETILEDINNNTATEQSDDIQPVPGAMSWSNIVRSETISINPLQQMTRSM